MKKLLNVLFFIILLGKISFCQDAQLSRDIAEASSPFPSVESGEGIGAESMVDLPTGRAKYSIPVFSHSVGMAKLNIGLTYLSGGVQVEKVAGWVGMDWNLSGGGFIERELNNIEDEKPNNGYIDYAKNDLDNFENLTSDGKRNFIKNASKRENDSEMDKFHFSFGGYSGFFSFDSDGIIHTSPNYDLVFEEVSIDDVDRIDGFTIRDNKGIVYTFGYDTNAVEKISSSMFSVETELNAARGLYDLRLDMTPQGQYQKTEFEFVNGSGKEKHFNLVPYTSKWYLTSVEFPDNTYLKYSYSHLGTDYYSTGEKIVRTSIGVGFDYSVACADDPFVPCNSETECENNPHPFFCYFDYWLLKYYEDGTTENEEFISDLTISNYVLQASRIYKIKKYLNKIEFSDGTQMVFNVNTERQDARKAVKLEGVEVINNQGQIIERVELEYNTITSASYTGEMNDPFNLFEALMFRNVNFNYNGASDHVPARLCAMNPDLLASASYASNNAKYLLEGLKSYNYKRLFLNKVRIIGGKSGYQEYSFGYKTPEKLYRRVSSARTSFGFQDVSFVKTDSRLKIGHDQTFLLALNPSLEMGSNANSYGMLSSVSTSYGGNVEYDYEAKGKSICVSEIKQLNSDEELLITNKYSYSDIINADQKRSFPYYILNNKCIFGGGGNKVFQELDFYKHKYTVTANYNQVKANYTNGSPTGFGSVTVTKNNQPSGIIYSFTTDRDESYSLYNAPNLTAEVEEVDKPDICTGFSSVRRRKLDWEFVENNSLVQPFQPKNSNEHLRGLLRSISYKDNVTDETNIKSINYEYNFDITDYVYNKTAKGIRCFHRPFYKHDEIRYDVFQCIRHILVTGGGKYYGGVYYLHSDRVLLAKKTVVEKRGGSEVSSTTEYEYNNGLLKQQIDYLSDGSELTKQYRYPQEFPDAIVYRTMINRNMLNIPIETITLKNGKTMHSQITNFFCKDPVAILAPDGDNDKSYYINGTILPDRTFQLETNSALSDYSPVSTAFTLDARVNSVLRYDAYDSEGNLLQSHKTNDIPTSYIYGYNITLPIAEVVNAEYDEIYCNTFEEDVDFGATVEKYSADKHSGNYCAKLESGSYAGVNEFTVSELVSGNYKYSAWVKTNSPGVNLVVKDWEDNEPWLATDVGNTNGEWKYIEKVINIDDPDFSATNTIRCEVWNSNAGTAYVDNVRFYPADAQITTYTYKPLVGVTSITDPNNKTVTYEYDGLGRLTRIFDNNGNIINEYEYNYARPFLAAESNSIEFPEAGGVKEVKIFKNNVNSLSVSVICASIQYMGLTTSLVDYGAYAVLTLTCPDDVVVWSPVKSVVTVTGSIAGTTYTETIQVFKYSD